MNSTPNFYALRAVLKDAKPLEFPVPSEKRGTNKGKSKPACMTGKESFQSVSDVKRAQQIVGSTVRFKRYYRCNICGQYHFSQKDEDTRHPLPYNRRSVNGEVKGLLFLSIGASIDRYTILP